MRKSSSLISSDSICGERGSASKAVHSRNATRRLLKSVKSARHLKRANKNKHPIRDNSIRVLCENLCALCARLARSIFVFGKSESLLLHFAAAFLYANLSSFDLQTSEISFEIQNAICATHLQLACSAIESQFANCKLLLQQHKINFWPI